MRNRIINSDKKKIVLLINKQIIMLDYYLKILKRNIFSKRTIKYSKIYLMNDFFRIIQFNFFLPSLTSK